MYYLLELCIILAIQLELKTIIGTIFFEIFKMQQKQFSFTIHCEDKNEKEKINRKYSLKK